VNLWRFVARLTRNGPVTVAAEKPSQTTVLGLAAKLNAAARTRLGRSLALRHVDAGSCNGCELELNALTNIVYDLERFGLRFVASPRHADVLLVTGPLTRNLQEALLRTWDATPDPKWVVAIGDCAVDGGVFKGSYACCGGVTSVPVDLHIRGCPPTPPQILEGLTALLEANAPKKARGFAPRA
jgi:Ni,Fe-hydrogenase III small subunit